MFEKMRADIVYNINHKKEIEAERKSFIRCLIFGDIVIWYLFIMYL